MFISKLEKLKQKNVEVKQGEEKANKAIRKLLEKIDNGMNPKVAINDLGNDESLTEHQAFRKRILSLGFDYKRSSFEFVPKGYTVSIPQKNALNIWQNKTTILEMVK